MQSQASYPHEQRHKQARMRSVFSPIFMLAICTRFRLGPSSQTFPSMAGRYCFKEGLRRPPVLLHVMNLCGFAARLLRGQMPTYALLHAFSAPCHFPFRRKSLYGQQHYIRINSESLCSYLSQSTSYSWRSGVQLC